MLKNISTFAANDNLQILQDLQKKQQLLKKQSRDKADSGDDAAAVSSGSGGGTGAPVVATTQRERSALQNALQNSNGYFISQDSSFGNLILPVLPRF